MTEKYTTKQKSWAKSMCVTFRQVFSPWRPEDNVNINISIKAMMRDGGDGALDSEGIEHGSNYPQALRLILFQ